VLPSCCLAQAGCCVASCCADLESSHHAALLSSHCLLTALPSCCLISLAGCCVASCCPSLLLSSHFAALTLSCTGWLLCRLLLRCPLVLSLCRPLGLSSFSHCAALSLSHHTGWLLHCLSLHCPLVVLSLHHPLVVLLRLVVALPLVAPLSCSLFVPSCHRLVACQLVVAWPPSNNAANIERPHHHRHRCHYGHSCCHHCRCHCHCCHCYYRC
jgi:hypothetical protein